MKSVTSAARLTAIIGSILSATGAALLLLQFGVADGFRLVDVVLSFLVFLTTLWLSWGAGLGLIGLFWPSEPRNVLIDGAPIRGRTAVLVPVYNEDPASAFARVAAMDASLAATGLGAKFDFAILSDTTREDIAAAERLWFVRLLETRGAKGRIYYRRRETNTGRKAGNIKDFIERSGSAYDYALILDADSLMEAETIITMVRRMEADDRLGLLQSLPKIVKSRSIFGRAMQFSANFYSPVFARGQEVMQGGEGPFWGHNALVRVRAFAATCGLPDLAGKAPFGGPILSHDYVEAALLASGGWRVRLDSDLEGSFEEAPENMIEYAKRDRRWCQGNIQHAALVGAPRLKAWSRFVFVQGIMSYIAPLLWVAFLVSNLQATATAPEPDYFPELFQLFPVFPSDQTSKAIALGLGIIGLLILPKVLIAVTASLTGRAGGFGGALKVTWSTLSELLLSSINAPVMLAFQTRSVLQVLSGIDGGWPATNRDQDEVPFGEAVMASHWIVLCGVALFAASWYFAPALIIWLIPVGLPLVFAPVIIWLTAKKSNGTLFTSPAELDVPPIVAAHTEILSQWLDADRRARIVSGNLVAETAQKGTEVVA